MFSIENSRQAEATRQQDGAMPRPLKPTNPYASWTALFSATLQRLRQELPEQPAVTQAEFGRRVYASGSKVSAIERGQVRPDAAFVEACERELPAGGILRAMLPLVIREWEYWARLGTTPPTSGLLPPDGIAPPGEVAATPAELADVAFLEAAANGAVEAVELARDAEASDIGAGTLENIDLGRVSEVGRCGEMLCEWDEETSPTSNGPGWSRCCPRARSPAGHPGGASGS
jgi:hypothetical protein